jgi:hypothetical protein
VLSQQLQQPITESAQENKKCKKKREHTKICLSIIKYLQNNNNNNETIIVITYIETTSIPLPPPAPLLLQLNLMRTNNVNSFSCQESVLEGNIF